jgi:uncharacterized protein YdaT
MPWKPSDAMSKTKKATTSKAKKAWSSTANAVLKRSGDEASAVRIANSVVKKQNRAKRLEGRKL